VALTKRKLPHTVVLNNETKIIEAIKRFQTNTKRFWGACVDSSIPSFSIGKVKQGYVEARKRGVRILYITEITRENLPYCNEIMQFAELRHLDAISANFAVSDREYVAGTRLGNRFKSLVQSDVKELVQQQRLVFDTLWQHAIPAKVRIEQLLG
jgi:hypothetical protein